MLSITIKTCETRHKIVVNVIIQSVFILNVTIKVNMLSVVMNNVVKLTVAAPQEHLSENS